MYLVCSHFKKAEAYAVKCKQTIALCEWSLLVRIEKHLRIILYSALCIMNF